MCHVDPSFQEGKCLQHFCHRNIRTWRSKMQHDMRASVVLFTAQRACQPPNHTFGSYAICLHLLICQGCGCWGRVEWHYDDVWGGRWIHIIFFWQCALVWGPSLDFLKMRTLILVGIASTSVFPPLPPAAASGSTVSSSFSSSTITATTATTTASSYSSLWFLRFCSFLLSKSFKKKLLSFLCFFLSQSFNAIFYRQFQAYVMIVMYFIWIHQ